MTLELTLKMSFWKIAALFFKEKSTVAMLQSEKRIEIKFLGRFLSKHRNWGLFLKIIKFKFQKLSTKVSNPIFFVKIKTCFKNLKT
jgi:hypothetical protein